MFESNAFYIAIGACFASVAIFPMVAATKLLRHTPHLRMWVGCTVFQILLIVGFAFFAANEPHFPNPLHNTMMRYMFVVGGAFMLFFSLGSLRTVQFLLEADQLRIDSRTDSLTGLTNRRGMDEALDTLMDDLANTETPVAAIMIDIDHFKQVNDHFGHAFGDLAIRTVAHAMKTDIASGDTIARLGGEEFIILMPNASVTAAEKRAERIRESVENLVIETPERSTRITVSLGVALSKPTDTGRDLIHRADERLYNAKNSGRNQVCSRLLKAI